MPKKRADSAGEIKPINRWVAEALGFSGITQKDLADQLAAMKVITSKDRSFVNKMVTGRRKVSAEEALAISTITKYPPLAAEVTDADRAEVLRIYDSLSPHLKSVYLQQVRALEAAGPAEEPSRGPVAKADPRQQ